MVRTVEMLACSTVQCRLLSSTVAQRSAAASSNNDNASSAFSNGNAVGPGSSHKTHC
jgi:hypothetical protein